MCGGVEANLEPFVPGSVAGDEVLCERVRRLVGLQRERVEVAGRLHSPVGLHFSEA